ncbi:MAG: hypothetical protein BWY49_00026 [Candidatus Omnitrophica bacterium ADurb.Bin314]|jgi:hypothetical protein|nr:MAG: hypothetical protein BWY49_00026 [Candidatus Omnitrophica bacterium ADurb.Bin314]
MGVYKELIDMKFGRGVPTFKLLKKFPQHKKKIHEVALMGIQERTLKKTVADKRLLKKILALKKKYPLPKRLRPKKTSPLEKIGKVLCPWL